MKVSDLAEELEVPPSAILQQCQRFGIDAAWAGAELSGADVVVLRAELASSAPIDLTPTDPVVEPDPALVAAGSTADDVPDAPSAGDAAPAPEPAPTASTAPPEPPADDAGSAPTAEVPGDPGPPAPDPADGGALPPTAVGSLPEIIDEVTPEAVATAATPRAPGFSLAGADASKGGVAGAEEVRTVKHREPPAKRTLERTVRTSVLALLVAVAAFVGSNFVSLAAVVVGLWLVTVVALVVAVIDGFRGRHRALVHPERTHGAVLATVVVVLAIAGIIGMTVTVMTVVGDEPAADAPLGIGDLESVQLARWGYQRSQRLADNGWKQPARQAGTCWSADRKRDPRAEDRVDESKVNDQETCAQEHTHEVAKVFAVNREADAPYPGAEKLTALAQEVCGPLVMDLAAETDAAIALVPEYPTEVGWADGDHDVACLVSIDPARKGKLVD